MEPSTYPLQPVSLANPDITPGQAAARKLLADICDMIHPGLSASLSWSSDVRGAR